MNQAVVVLAGRAVARKLAAGGEGAEVWAWAVPEVEAEREGEGGGRTRPEWRRALLGKGGG